MPFTFYLTFAISFIGFTLSMGVLVWCLVDHYMTASRKSLAKARAKGIRDTRACVANHMDWNPETVREDILLNIDMLGFIPTDGD